jgi:hypothetical protein
MVRDFTGLPIRQGATKCRIPAAGFLSNNNANRRIVWLFGQGAASLFPPRAPTSGEPYDH